MIESHERGVSRDGDSDFLTDVQAVIDSARLRAGTEPLVRFVRGRLPRATEAEVLDATELAEEIIDTIPVFLARAHQEAEDRGLESVVLPVLRHAERYFLHPVDLIPEMTQGLVGLLDDTYLVIRILKNLDQGPQPFLDWDLDYPMEFLHRMVGDEIALRLDLIAADAMEQVSHHFQQLWDALAHSA